MLYAVSKDKPGFEFLSTLDKRSVPRNALIFLWSLFSISIGMNYLFPTGFERMLQIVSANFVVLYILASLSYVRYSVSSWKKALGVFIAVVLTLGLLSDPYLLIYPIVLISVGFVYSFLSGRRVALRGEIC